VPKDFGARIWLEVIDYYGNMLAVSSSFESSKRELLCGVLHRRKHLVSWCDTRCCGPDVGFLRLLKLAANLGTSYNQTVLN